MNNQVNHRLRAERHRLQAQFWGNNPNDEQLRQAEDWRRWRFNHINIQDNGQVFNGHNLIGTLIPSGRHTQDIFDPLRNAVEEFYARDRGSAWARAANGGVDPPHNIKSESDSEAADLGSDNGSDLESYVEDDMEGLVGAPNPPEEELQDSDEDERFRPPSPFRVQAGRLSPASLASLQALQEQDEDMRFASLQRMESETQRLERCQYLNQLLRRKIELDFQYARQEFERRSSLQFLPTDAAYAERVRRRLETACSAYYNEYSLDLEYFRTNSRAAIELSPHVHMQENIFNSRIKSFDWWFNMDTAN